MNKRGKSNDESTVAEAHVGNSSSSMPFASYSLQFQKIFAAVFYGISSILVIFTNKAVMSRYHFKYFDVLAAVQFAVTTLILLLLVLLKRIEIPPLTYNLFKEIIPITLMFLGNVLCGLGSTKSLSIPMFTVLRRFSIMMTMLGEWYLLKTKVSQPVVVSVGLMVAGALVASLYDLHFDALGYAWVGCNNVFTALNGVYMKKAAISGKCSRMAVLFYNSLFSALIMLLYFLLQHLLVHSLSPSSLLPLGGSSSSLRGAVSGPLGAAFTRQPLLAAPPLSSLPDTSSPVPAISFSSSRHLLSSSSSSSSSLLDLLLSPWQISPVYPSSLQPLPPVPPVSVLPLGSPVPVSSVLEAVFAFPAWQEPSFVSLFVLAVSMGSILNYSIFLCTTLNSALTTAVVGATKNILTTYIGMIAFDDYDFAYLNFLGLNISILGSLYYTYVILFKGAIGFGGT